MACRTYREAVYGAAVLAKAGLRCACQPLDLASAITNPIHSQELKWNTHQTLTKKNAATKHRGQLPRRARFQTRAFMRPTNSAKIAATHVATRFHVVEAAEQVGHALSMGAAHRHRLWMPHHRRRRRLWLPHHQLCHHRVLCRHCSTRLLLLTLTSLAVSVRGNHRLW